MVEHTANFFYEVTFFVEVKTALPLGHMSFVDNPELTVSMEEFRSQNTAFWLTFSNCDSDRDSMPADLVSIGSDRLLQDGSIFELKQFLKESENQVFTFLSYDLKNDLEDLTAENHRHYDVPKFLAFEGEKVVNGDTRYASVRVKERPTERPIDLVPALNREAYTAKVESIKRHIQLGDVYELNFCFEHVAENVDIDPVTVFMKLKEENPAPFSAYFKHEDVHCICNSPERFMAKTGSRVFSQPMKGTNNSADDDLANSRQKNLLQNDPKERAENIMITDLVRNDLSKSAKPGSVKVDELCGVYRYGSVNQMLSTVSCELRDDLDPIDAVLAAFPMGSMTGAPKHRAMQLIDQYEDFSRGIFSGSLGYFKPNGDFDLNVVIRSLIYDERTKRLSLPTGSAITIHSDPNKEYDECLLKAQRIKDILNGG